MNQTTEKQEQGFLDKLVDALDPGISLKQRFSEHPVLMTGALVVGTAIVASSAAVSGFVAFVLAASFPAQSLTMLSLAAGALLAVELHNDASDQKKAHAKTYAGRSAAISPYDDEPPAKNNFMSSLKNRFAAVTGRKALTKDALPPPVVLNYASVWKQRQ